LTAKYPPSSAMSRSKARHFLFQSEFNLRTPA